MDRVYGALKPSCYSPKNGSLYKVDSAWSWVVCFSGIVCNILGIGLCYSFGILYQALLKELNESRERTAWIGSLTISITHFGGVLAGFMCDRLGYRATAVIGSLSCSIGLFATSYVRSAWVMYFTYSTLFGIGLSLLMTVIYVLTAKYFKRHRSLSLGLLGAGISLGILVMSRLTRLLLDTFQLWNTLRILAAVELLNILAACIFSPNVEVAEGTHDERTDCQSNDERPSGWSRLVDCSMWKVPTFVVYCLAADVSFLGIFVPQVHMAVHCEDLGINADLAAWLYVYYGLASLVGRIVAGRLIDRTGINIRYIFQVSLAIQGFATVLCPLATVYTSLVAYMMVFGFFNGSFCTCIDSLILTSMPDSCKAKAFGMYLTSVTIPAAVGPPLAGLTADISSSYVTAFYISGAVIIFASTFPFLLLFIKGKQDNPEIDKQCYETEEVILIDRLTVL